jgi:hypothetical protein
MGRDPSPKKLERKRSYTASRIAREVEGPEPERLLRVWRRVLERRLRTRLRARVAVEIHDNTHTMVTFQRLRKMWRLRLHHMFLAASDDVLTALANFIHGVDPASSLGNKAFIRRLPLAEQRKRLRIVTKGRSHDLVQIFSALNERYFQNRVSATITYGPAPRRRRPRKSIKMGSYSSESKVIRIHPALDHERVPRYFVEWIVFHEMLHHVHRARRLEDGRRCVHTPEFCARERTFHHYKRAQRWERENLDFLLRSRPT